MIAASFETACDLIYEAALAPECWPSALAALCHLSASASASIVVFRGGRLPSVASTGPVGGVLDDLMTRADWLDSYSVTQALDAGPPSFLYDADFFPPEMLDGDPLRRPVLRQYGLGGQTASLLRLATGENVIFTFEHALGAARPGAQELAILDSFRPHLARAAQTSARLRLRSAQSAVATLSTLGMPAAVINRQAKVLAANQMMIAMSGVIRIGARDQLTLLSQTSQRLFSEAIRDQGPADIVRSFPIQAVGENGDQIVVVLHVLPLKHSARDLFAASDLLVVATVALPGMAAPGSAVLESLFDLTPAEARLASALGSGLSLRDAATRCGVKFNSARTCLERIFRKTGTNRQSQLLDILRAAHPFRPLG